MHKELQPTRASRFKRAAIVTFILAFICFVFARARSTTASLAIVGAGTNLYGSFVMLQFSNPGPATISYRGYDTNRPFYNLQFQTPLGPSNYYKPFNAVLRVFELNPHQTMNFRVMTYNRGADYQVTLDYGLPEPLDWFRDHTPSRISRWLPRPSRPTAFSPLIKSNSLVTETH